MFRFGIVLFISITFAAGCVAGGVDGNYAISSVQVSSNGSVAEFLPAGVEILTSDESGKTWRQSGFLHQPFAMALVTVRTAMLRYGFHLVHDMGEEVSTDRRIQLWRDGKKDIIVMLWSDGLYSTGVSWGESVRDDSLDSASIQTGEHIGNPVVSVSDSSGRFQLPSTERALIQ